MLLTAIILSFIWCQIIVHFGASILLHKHYCHRQFEVPVWFEIVGLFMLSVAYVRSPIGWIASHRMHHAYSDTEKDPHSWRYQGKLKILTTTWTMDNIPARFARDLYKNPRLVFFHKYHKHLLAFYWIVSFIISPYFFLAFALIPFIFAKIGFGLLNTLGHTEVGGSNIPWLNIFNAGEGYHKNHHLNSRLVRLHKWDISGWIAEKMFVEGSHDK